MTDVVDEIVLSAEVGHAKPEARMFRTALARVALDASDALFVADTAQHVAAAEALACAVTCTVIQAPPSRSSSGS